MPYRSPALREALSANSFFAPASAGGGAGVTLAAGAPPLDEGGVADLSSSFAVTTADSFLSDAGGVAPRPDVSDGIATPGPGASVLGGSGAGTGAGAFATLGCVG